MDQLEITRFKFDICLICKIRYSCLLTHSFTVQDFARYQTVEKLSGHGVPGFQDYMAREIKGFKTRIKTGWLSKRLARNANCLDITWDSATGDVENVKFNLNYCILELFENGELERGY